MVGEFIHSLLIKKEYFHCLLIFQHKWMFQIEPLATKIKAQNQTQNEFMKKNKLLQWHFSKSLMNYFYLDFHNLFKHNSYMHVILKPSFLFFHFHWWNLDCLVCFAIWTFIWAHSFDLSFLPLSDMWCDCWCFFILFGVSKFGLSFGNLISWAFGLSNVDANYQS